MPWIETRALVREKKGYIPGDGHFSVAGNAVIGQALADKLVPLLEENAASQPR